MLYYSIERLVIEHRHKLCLGRSAVRILQAENPLLLLSWHELVAERGPLHLQFLGRQYAPDASAVLIQLVILYPCYGVCNAIAVFLLILECACHYAVVHAQRTTLKYLFAREERIYGIPIVVRRCHLYPCRAVSLAKLGVRLIPPVVGVGHRLGVCLAEHHEVMLHCIVATYRHQRVFA